MACGLWPVACSAWFVAGTRGLQEPTLRRSHRPHPTTHYLFTTYHVPRTTYHPPRTMYHVPPFRRLRRLPQGGGREESAACGLRNRAPTAVGSMNDVLGGCS